jgi:arylformamidase
MKIYDLTPKIHSGLGVFPGDISFKRNISMDFKTGDHLLLSAIETTLHLGAHADSSNHYHANGEGVDQRPLASFVGPAQVIRVESRANSRIQMKDLEGKIIRAPRVLFCTNSFPNPDHWNSDFMALSPEVIQFLHSKDCVLVGIDTPSVDPEDSKALESHQALFQTKMSVLEGLILKHVPEGIYWMVALPLPIQNADASPVRALLFEGSQQFPDLKKFEIIGPQ